MTLILSSLTTGEDQLRRTLDRLAKLGIPNHDIIVLHPGGALGLATEAPALVDGETKAGSRMATVGSVASNSAVIGMFGWLVGTGIMAIPGGILLGAIGAVTGAVIGAVRHPLAHHVPDEVQHHYANRIVDDHAAILVKVEDPRTYEMVLNTYLDNDCRHILTCKNNPAVAESDQLAVITQAARDGALTGLPQEATGRST